MSIEIPHKQRFLPTQETSGVAKLRSKSQGIAGSSLLTFITALIEQRVFLQTKAKHNIRISKMKIKK